MGTKVNRELRWVTAVKVGETQELLQLFQGGRRGPQATMHTFAGYEKRASPAGWLIWEKWNSHFSAFAKRWFSSNVVQQLNIFDLLFSGLREAQDIVDINEQESIH